MRRPRTVPQLRGLIDFAGGDRHFCVVTLEGRVTCLGDNSLGQLGVTNVDDSAEFVEAEGLSNVVELVAGAHHSCARQPDGVVLCWGDHYRGQVGHQAEFGGDDRQIRRPPRAVELPTATGIGAGREHSCAVVEEGSVYCWGSNTNGQIGMPAEGFEELMDDGIPPLKTSTPYAVVGIADAVEVAATSEYTCARLQDGQVACWGRHPRDGEEPSSTDINQGVAESWPRRIEGLADATALSVGGRYTCAHRTTGEVACWGLDEETYEGEIDPGHGPQAATLVDLGQVEQLSAGASHMCALRSSGAILCWGSNHLGQLGVEGGDSPVPVLVRDPDLDAPLR